MIATQTIVGPRLHGRKRSLKSFEFAKVEDGYQFELARGYVVVSEVPGFSHGMQVVAIKEALFSYRMANVGAVHAILSRSECKLLIPAWESERHPDIAVYLSAPKGSKNRTMWRTWIPDLVVEVVSESSRDRDYTQKREEYWTLGVKEYWIVDAKLLQVVVLKRGRSQWTEKFLGQIDVCETKLLPGFKLACKAVFEAGGTEDDE